MTRSAAPSPRGRSRWRRRPVQEHVDVGLDLRAAYEAALTWRGEGGTQTIGVVTFHRLDETLTRIQITASGTRISRRALKSDLRRLKAFIALRDLEDELDELEPPRSR